MPAGYSFDIDDDKPEDVDDTEFDTFTVRITHPMRHDLTHEALRDLLHRGAFNGIQDGREDEHGTVFIKDFALLPSTEDARNQKLGQDAPLASASFGLVVVAGAMLSLVVLASAIGGAKHCRKAPYCAVAANDIASSTVLIEDSAGESPTRTFT